jgi:hypothetical protein
MKNIFIILSFLVIFFLIHNVLSQIGWYRGLPSFKGQYRSIHLGEIILFSLPIVIWTFFNLKKYQLEDSHQHCQKCDKITKVSKHTELLSQEQKISLQNKHPHRFTEIGVKRETLLDFDVSETLVLCDICNTEIEVTLNKANPI